MMIRPGETQTAFAIRRIQAEAWDEGFNACFDVTGEPVKQDVPNPYHEEGA
jgi:hypothetical protein